MASARPAAAAAAAAAPAVVIVAPAAVFMDGEERISQTITRDGKLRTVRVRKRARRDADAAAAAAPECAVAHPERELDADLFARLACPVCYCSPMREVWTCGQHDQSESPQTVRHTVCGDCVRRIPDHACPICRVRTLQQDASTSSLATRLELRCTGCPDAGVIRGTGAFADHVRRVCPRSCPHECAPRRVFAGQDAADTHAAECAERPQHCAFCADDAPTVPMNRLVTHVSIAHPDALVVSGGDDAQWIRRAQAPRAFALVFGPFADYAAHFTATEGFGYRLVNRLPRRLRVRIDIEATGASHGTWITEVENVGDALLSCFARHHIRTMRITGAAYANA